MHILIAPDSFKESLPAPQVATAIRRGLEVALPDASFDLLPLGDGGEGTVACLQEALGFTFASHRVTGPFGNAVTMPYALKGTTALFEMADLVGLGTIPLEKRNPLTIQTRGIGELLCHLAEVGVQQVFVGIGGSSTNDGGIGMAAGLGYQFLDKEGHPLPAIGQSLGQVASVLAPNLPQSLLDLDLQIMTDVSNPLCGPNGATKVFSKQKGLPEEDQDQVDQAMHDFYNLVNPGLLSLPGAGAGGGMAAGLVAFVGGKIVSGIETCLDLLDFDERVRKADLVVVGEGRLDQQSLSGKTPIGVARRTPAGIPVLAICGSLSEDLPNFPVENIQAAFSIISRLDTLEATLASAEKNLTDTAKQIGNLIQTIQKIKENK